MVERNGIEQPQQGQAYPGKGGVYRNKKGESGAKKKIPIWRTKQHLSLGDKRCGE